MHAQDMVLPQISAWLSITATPKRKCTFHTVSASRFLAPRGTCPSIRIWVANSREGMTSNPWAMYSCTFCEVVCRGKACGRRRTSKSTRRLERRSSRQRSWSYVKDSLVCIRSFLLTAHVSCANASLLLEEFAIYMNYVRKLGFEETPDYDFLRELFTKVLKTLGEPEDGVFDWMLLNGGKGWEAGNVCFLLYCLTHITDSAVDSCIPACASACKCSRLTTDPASGTS